MSSSAALPLSPAAATTRPLPIPWAPLLSRTVFFAAAQALIATGLAISGHETPWQASAGWWPVSAFLANLASMAVIRRFAREEGLRWRELFHVDGRFIGRDLLVFLGVLVVMAPVAQLPNMALATLFWGSPDAALAQFVQVIPRVAALVGLVLFPLTIIFAELPTYFAVATRRMERAGWKGPMVVLLPALFLAFQHVTLPLIFDLRFFLWRLLMFIPFALFVGLVVRWRPRLLPWFMVVHGLIDSTVAWMVYAKSV